MENCCILCGNKTQDSRRLCWLCESKIHALDNLKQLYLLCGPSGSGKSTFSHSLITQGDNAIVVSRDIIRFSLLKDGEPYFKKEKAVFRNYVNSIQTAINNNINIVVADATHLNEASRNKLLDALNLKDYEIVAVNFTLPIHVCLERNARRTGLSKVPEHVIRQQFENFVPAAEGEKYKYTKIFNI